MATEPEKSSRSTKKAAQGSRLESLDALRGIAALGVVFWHFRHFGGDPTEYPYANVWGASWMYSRGWVLVDFFFLLSGIVFTYKYLRPVADQSISGRDFFALRVSRIYPLHCATLLMVAAVQWWHLAHGQPTLLYQNNDAYHFVLNLFFLQRGWFEDGPSFNSPSWSVASEVFVYFVFFFVASRYPGRYVARAVCLALVGLAVFRINWNYPLANPHLARGVLGFFFGSLLYLGATRAVAAGYRWHVGIGCMVSLAVIVGMAQLIGYDTFIGGAEFRIVPSHVVVIFPLILVSALTLPWLAKALSIRPLTFLGDISYTLYMLHVPVQLVILTILKAKNAVAPSSEPWFFWSYFVGLLVLAALTHRFFEIPLRNWLRRRLLTPRPRATHVSPEAAAKSA